MEKHARCAPLEDQYVKSEVYKQIVKMFTS